MFDSEKSKSPIVKLTIRPTVVVEMDRGERPDGSLMSDTEMMTIANDYWELARENIVKRSIQTDYVIEPIWQ